MYKRFMLLMVASQLIVLPQKVLAWGEEGHAIVAEIAQRRLSSDAATAIVAILGDPTKPAFTTPSLASIATWPDEVRYNADGTKNGTYNWHFVDIPRQTVIYDPATECKADDPQGDCVIAELERLKTDLRCKTGEDRRSALKFAVHFVGDIHQPLHTILESIGGNAIKVKVGFDGNTCKNADCRNVPSNLHVVWDTELLRRKQYSWQTYVNDLEGGWLKSDAALQDSQDNITQWALATHKAATDYAVWVEDGATLDTAYYARVIPLVDQQLGLAGLRLARYLNGVFAAPQCPSK